MKQKVLLFIICVETAIICFFLFGFVIHLEHYRPRFQPFFPHQFSVENVYETFNMSNEQRVQYDKIYSEYVSNQKKYFIRNRELMIKLHAGNINPNASQEDIDKYADEVGEIIKGKFTCSVQYINQLKSILNDDQKILLADIMKNKELYKIMPNFGVGYKKRFGNHNKWKKGNYPKREFVSH